MGDRTSELRDLFESVTGTETVTERQQDTRGTLGSEQDVRAALIEAIEDMREALEFETGCATAQLATIVEGYYAGRSDAEIAAEHEDLSEAAVTTARYDLHLQRSTDPDERSQAVRAERRRVADRYRQAFESILEDRDIADRLTSSLEETGLDESLADQEVDVDM
ncbi:conditioned medium-induced protein 4 [Halodesulfurarchaeum sp. HSR-GB]|uniref:conditioned medium-induced protein 4 n=1 Tax=Halodesulfurarchaeum sp. HSR-GB TaxID=3074077 RepID=UPI00285A0370|nr:conditioned medium-induced protein 4 [Halodesulfurarchaeum sp. HSR-GB]MDR5656087.1 conditioned medium-induced protein 4 [Halodesulfurarchaeum sp. HSR-GB]